MSEVRARNLMGFPMQMNWTPRSSFADETAAFDALSLLSGPLVTSEIPAT
jgi:hypothetical protein